MRLSHARRAIDARFDDPNLVSCAGLVPVMALAQRCGLATLLAERLTIAAKGGVNAAAKVLALIAGMVCGADSIDDMDLLRHGGMGRLFDGIRAPSTLGTFLRAFTFGHVRQLDAVAAGLLARLAAATPVLPDAREVVLVDIDDTVRQTYGYAKQGAGRGYTGIKGLNALLATVSTPISAPLIAATRLRKGSTNSARGAATLLADALATIGRCGATGLVIVRADSAYYGYEIIDACRRAGARFSVTARLTPTVVRAITSIDGQAWTPIRYPNAIYDEDEQRWVSDAEVAEVGFTAFTNRRRGEHVTARLIVRRVRRLNPATVPAGADRSLRRLPLPRGVHRLERADAARRSHPPRPRHHRAGHRRAEERPAGPPALGPVHRRCGLARLHRDLPHLTRAAGALAGGRHRRSRTGTIRAQLITTPARSRTPRTGDPHLPRDWPFEPGLDELFRRALHDPLPAAA